MELVLKVKLGQMGIFKICLEKTFKAQTYKYGLLIDGGLYENGFHRPLYINACSPVGGTVF